MKGPFIYPAGTTVQDVFPDIDEDTMMLLAEQKEEYWAKVQSFWSGVKDKDANSLTVAQTDWLERIEEDCRNY